MSAAAISARPRCPHFGPCGGCQYQDVAYEEQLRQKRTRLEGLMRDAGVSVPPMETHSAEPWEYRNRIRLRLERVEGVLRFGYNMVNTAAFLPIAVCPISAPVLLAAAEALLAAAVTDRDAAFWMDAASEVELFCDRDLARVQMTLHCAPRTKVQSGSFARMLVAVGEIEPRIVGAEAIAADVRSGPTGRTLDAAGATGLTYRVGDEDYWITRGGFFQVNRFLISTLVDLVCKDDDTLRAGELAWDLFAGVGLFSRVLARGFTRVTAVEANAVAAKDLRVTLRKVSPLSTTVEATTLDFLRRAVLDRERPELIVLDPPRAGAGVEACELLNRLAPKSVVYVSCDPATLARDLQVLTRRYKVQALHLVDLFPQTVHLETVAVLERVA
jgi:23S rRNA (uracil1939-C5)-methyltransferase